MRKRVPVVNTYFKGALFSACWCGVAGAQMAGAPENAQPALQEIVVTATKTKSTVGDVPAALTAITANSLEEGQVTQLADIATLVPNLDFGEAFGQVKLTMRGIGFSNLAMGTEGSVALNVDGVYISRPAGQAGLLFDIAQVEALRGPQGTLYGRNATGGTLNYTTTRPTPQWASNVSLLAGNYDHRRGEFGIGGPIAASTLTFRLAGLVEDSGGYGTNVVNGRDVDNRHTRAARLSLLLKPPDTTFQNLLIVDYNREKDASALPYLVAQAGLTGEPGTVPIGITGLALGGTAIFSPYNVAYDYQPSYRRRGWGVTNIASLDAGLFQIKSTTAYRRLNWWAASDLDGTSAPVAFIQNGEDDKQFSQEIDANASTERLDTTFGVYYFHEYIDGLQLIPFYVGGSVGQLGQGFAAGGLQTTNAYAGFGQGTLKLSKSLSITAGLRYSYEKKDETDLYTDFVNDTKFLEPYNPGNPPFEAPFPQQAHWSSTTPKLGVEYRPRKAMLLYASASKGFKAGGFNFGGTATPPGEPNKPSNPAVAPETVWAYEAGVKDVFAGGRADLNTAAFYYDYKDLQISQITGYVTQFTNAAAARVYGIEAELQTRVTEHLNVDANVTWLHARFTQFETGDASRPGLGVIDVAGNPLPQAPDYTAHLAGDYTFDLAGGKLILRGEYDWTDRIYYDEYRRALISQASYGKVNTFLTYRTPDGSWDLSVFAKNLTDKKTYSFKYVSTSTFGYPLFGFVDPPRTFGVQARYSF